MKKLLQLICLTNLMLMLVQCKAQDPEHPVPVETIPVQGTFRMTYYDYRVSKYGTSSTDYLEIPVAKNNERLARTVTVTTVGDQLSIKGMFPEYPDACVKGMIKGDTIYFEPTQRLEGAGGKTVYVHSGSVSCRWLHTKESISLRIPFNPTISQYNVNISDDGEINSLKAWNGGAFWLSDDEVGNESFYSVWRNGRVEGTGFPASPNHITYYRSVFREDRRLRD